MTLCRGGRTDEIVGSSIAMTGELEGGRRAWVEGVRRANAGVRRKDSQSAQLLQGGGRTERVIMMYEIQGMYSTSAKTQCVDDQHGRRKESR